MATGPCHAERLQHSTSNRARSARIAVLWNERAGGRLAEDKGIFEIKSRPFLLPAAFPTSSWNPCGIKTHLHLRSRTAGRRREGCGVLREWRRAGLKSLTCKWRSERGKMCACVCVCVRVFEFTGTEPSPPSDTGRAAEALEGTNEEKKKMSRRKKGPRENN